MFGNNIRIYSPIIFGSVLTSLFTLLALSVNVSAQNIPDYLGGNLTLESNLTREQVQELDDKITNYTNTMKKEANGNQTKLNVLLIEDLAKRNIIDQEAKQGFLAFIATTNKPPVVGLPGNLTIPGNTTDILKTLNASSTILDEIANNSSDSERSQTVSLMTDILKKRVSDIGTFVSSNVTNTGPVTISDSDAAWAAVGKVATCTLIGGAFPGYGTALGIAAGCAILLA